MVSPTKNKMSKRVMASQVVTRFSWRERNPRAMVKIKLIMPTKLMVKKIRFIGSLPENVFFNCIIPSSKRVTGVET